MFDLVDRHVYEDGATVDSIHDLRHLIDGIFLRHHQAVDTALSEEGDVGVAEEHSVGILYRIDGTRGSDVRFHNTFCMFGVEVGMAIVLEGNGLATLTSSARSTAAIHRTSNVHITVGRVVLVLRVVAFTVDVDVGVTRNGGSTETDAVETTEVGTGKHVLTNDEGLGGESC